MTSTSLTRRVVTQLGEVRWWLITLVAVLVSEATTAALSALLCLWWWGEIDMGVMAVGAVDAGVVSLLVVSSVLVLARGIRDMERQAREEQARLVAELEEALADIRTLRGVLPICSHCKCIRDDDGAWQALETYVSHHSEALFSHGLCPSCAHELYRTTTSDPAWYVTPHVAPPLPAPDPWL